MNIGSQKYALIASACKLFFHFRSELIRRDAISAEKNYTVTLHRYSQCVFLCGIGHGNRILNLHQINPTPVVERSRTCHHENNEQHHYHSRHRH